MDSDNGLCIHYAVVVTILILIPRIGQCLWGCHHDKVITKVHSVHLTNVNNVAADPQTKPTNLDCQLAAIIYIHHHHTVLLIAQKAELT